MTWTDRSTDELTLAETALFAEVSVDEVCTALNTEVLCAAGRLGKILRRDVAAWIEERRCHAPPASDGLEASEQTTLLEKGFVHLPRVLSPGELAALSRASDAVLERVASGGCRDRSVFQSGADGPVLERVRGVEHDEPEFQHLLAHPILQQVSQALNCGPFLVYNVSLVVKLADVGVAIEAHRDPTWTTRLTSDAVVTVAFYLDASHRSNGGTYFHPGSHRLRHGRAPAGAESSDAGAAYWTECAQGDAVVHNLGVIHGSAKNTSRDRRRTLYYSLVSQREALQSRRFSESWINARLEAMRTGSPRGSE